MEVATGEQVEVRGGSLGQHRLIPEPAIVIMVVSALAGFALINSKKGLEIV